MSLHIDFSRLSIIRDHSRILAQRAGDHEGRLEALVAAADLHVRHLQDALSDVPDVPPGKIDPLYALLSTELRQSHDGARTARQLCAVARQQRLTANLLLNQLDPHPPREDGLRRDAVLVVDDHVDICDVVAEVLSSAGFVVRTARNGLEGLLTAYEMRPGVIVMDVTMPILDGVEATRLIKASEATRQARVIAYTGEPALDDNVVRKLFVAVVQKPATPAALLETVQRAARL